MTGSAEAPAGSGAPIAVQMISLLAAGWLITLVVAAVVALLLPPPPRPAYRISELADALQGGALASSDGRRLVRAHQASPPPPGEPLVSTGFYRVALAAALGQPVERVRLERHPYANPIRRKLLQVLQAGPTPAPGPPGMLGPPFNVGPNPGVVIEQPVQGAKASVEAARPPAPVGADRSPADAKAPGPAYGPGPSLLESVPPLPDDFSAAVKDPAGGWTVVRPGPEPFPSAWEQRVMLWVVACFALLTPIGYVFARRLAATIGGFATAAERLGRDPNAPPIELSGPAEIVRAAAAFNDMQARLRRYVEHRTEMIGAIAHDLRTPLSRIRFKIEALGPEAKEAIGRDVVQMEQMIAAALDFVRDASAIPPREPLELSSAVQCVVDSAALTGEDVELTFADPAIVLADALSLERLFTNLVSNALKYGVRARLKVYRDGPFAVVDVCDSGPGLPEGELERVFEPFYRLELSRSPDTGGMGLGLATSRAMARSLGGDVVLINAKPGLIARVRLPLAPGAEAAAISAAPASTAT